MNCFISSNTDIYYNLALEEFLLKKRSEDFFFLWRSEPTVVVGKHQNPYQEFDLIYAKENKINIARRLSGGGTVYHDLGNVNFTFIKNTENGKQINLKQHSKPIFAALKQMGLDVNYSERNDFLINGKKFSGNAEHIYKNRVLHHGTILFDTDLFKLNRILTNKYQQYNGKSLRSVKSRVANLKPYFQNNISILDFQKQLLKQVLSQSPEYVSSSPKKIFYFKEIENLIQEKYRTKEWIFNYTSKYELNNKFEFLGERASFYVKVEKGYIVDFKTQGLGEDVSLELKKKLINTQHIYKKICEIFYRLPEEYKCLCKRIF